MKDRVKPIRKKLSGTGTVWEYELFKRGWNDLPDSKKYGVIVGFYKLQGGQEVFDAFFPAFKLTLKNIFPDEMLLVEKEK